MKHIDPHVHCRDGKEAYKTTIREVSEIAKKQGVVAILDMAGVFTEKEAKERIALAETRQPVVPYFFYMRLTADKKQIEEAVRVVRDYPRVVGLKLKDVPHQKRRTVFKKLADMGYEGVLVSHCEKESKFQPRLWNPQQPWTHSLAQPPEAEIESVKDQISFAKKAKFQGNLHICHISCPESVELVWEAKKELNITSGATPHHLMFSEDLLRETQNGLLYKVSPPLRDQQRVKELRKCLLEKKIDWLETDHAPHTLEEKLNPPYLSGVTSLHLYGDLLNWLSSQGMIQLDIEKLTYWNIKRVFGEKLREV